METDAAGTMKQIMYRKWYTFNDERKESVMAGFNDVSFTNGKAHKVAEGLTSVRPPSQDEVAFKDGFINRIWDREFDDEKLEALDDEALTVITCEASRAYNAIFPKDPGDPTAVREMQMIYGVGLAAYQIIDGRRTERRNELVNQRHRQGAITSFANSAHTLCKRLAEVDFRPDIMCPDVEQPLTEEAAREIEGYRELFRIERESSFYIDLNRDELRRVEESVGDIRFLLASGAAEMALDDLMLRLDYLNAMMESKRETMTVARAEIERRAREDRERAKDAENLPETVAQLKQRIAELEGNV